MKRTLEQRFWAKVDSGNACWEWTAGKIKGYGQIQVNGKQKLAHRISWELHNGPIPKNLCVCHHCDNPGCVNPDHLFLGTQKDNMRDKLKKARQVKEQPKQRGEKHHNVKLAEEQVRVIKRLYGAPGISQRRLADIFGVSQVQIGRIVRGKTWAHLQ